MREIKFKIKYDKERTPNYEGLTRCAPKRFETKIWTLEELESGEAKAYRYYLQLYKVQYIGVKDKNGKEIYEGDILKADDEEYPTVENNAIGNVSMLENFAIWYVDGTINDGLGDLLNCASVYVVGNIHENPELINQ